MAPFDTGLAPTSAPDVALRHIVADCRAALRKYRAMVLQGRRPIGIHQTRVALRRLLGGVGHPAIALRVGVPVDGIDPVEAAKEGGPA